MILKHHQIEGAEWLAARRHALLADEMRVGKTLTALEAARLADAEHIAVVCPAVARFNWARNIWEHLGLPADVALTRKHRSDYPVVITSYDLLGALGADSYDVAIVDESHYLRRCEASRTKLILGKGGLVHRADRMWFLSGTPAVNNYSELWQMLHVCGRYAGSYEEFVRAFCIAQHTPYGLQIRGSKNHDKLAPLLDGFMLRRKFAEIAPDLPPIELSEYTVELDSLHGMLNNSVLREALASHDPMAALESAAPAVATLRRYLGLALVPHAAELVRSDLDGNTDKIVLFTYHREVMTGLMGQLKEFKPASIAGGDTAVSKAAAEKRFREDPECRVFVGQIVAAGTNIDLSAASNVIMVESSWVPGENAQALMRLQNMNQTNKVQARFLAMADSLHQQIQRVVMRKTRDLSKLFG